MIKLIHFDNLYFYLLYKFDSKYIYLVSVGDDITKTITYSKIVNSSNGTVFSKKEDFFLSLTANEKAELIWNA